MNPTMLNRAELFAIFSESPILFLEDLFGDKTNYWFICNDFSEANPSNHIHHNELRRGKCINTLMSSTQVFDKQMFSTKLEEITVSSIVFSKDVKWIKIR